MRKKGTKQRKKTSFGKKPNEFFEVDGDVVVPKSPKSKLENRKTSNNNNH